MKCRSEGLSFLVLLIVKTDTIRTVFHHLFLVVVDHE
jgi:hypothetical protein